MKHTFKLLSCILLILSLCFSMVSCGDIVDDFMGGLGEFDPEAGSEGGKKPSVLIPGEEGDPTPDPEKKPVPEVPVAKAGELSVHFIDVDQADCALIMDGDKVMLIDTGDYPNDDHKTYMLNYLKARGVETIDYLILTHPDADHIGGAPEVINTFDVKNCIMPAATKTTSVFNRTLDALEKNEVNVLVPVPGEVFALKDATFEILAPLYDDYDDSNNWSVVLRLDFGERSILFTGDAEDISEAEMVEKYKGTNALSADVLKVGHHGSNSSTTADFLSLVSPDYAIISCGVNNEYNHPRPAIINRLNGVQAEIYRTDKHGTVVLITDGEKLEFTWLTKEHKTSAQN